MDNHGDERHRMSMLSRLLLPEGPGSRLLGCSELLGAVALYSTAIAAFIGREWLLFVVLAIVGILVLRLALMQLGISGVAHRER